MKLDHYLTAVSAAIEAHEARMSAEYERYAEALRAANPDTLLPYAEHDAFFAARISASYLAMQDTIANLRKWPRQ